jgi:hypothetical protein
VVDITGQLAHGDRERILGCGDPASGRHDDHAAA